MNPNGGFLSRFPDLNLPALGIPFYGAAPEDSIRPSVTRANTTASRTTRGTDELPVGPQRRLGIVTYTQYVQTQRSAQASPDQGGGRGRDRAADHRSDAAVLLHSHREPCLCCSRSGASR
ncbi:hypothetical protein [Mycolicibacterium sp.]|uniref:hypothetical protein n=1 Tax=Mycolicibacterium sp. TaxID=2320850 RepID=UPI003455C6DB